ncbi:MAG: HAD-IA family hydrolase [Eubacteriales bacterium]|nr:HAD-IA family hydrolase [Eubacteriales bacterium]
MKAVILDMYGVIIRQDGSDFAPYVQKFFPELSYEQITQPWFRADRGEIGMLDVWEALGFKGDLEAIDREYLDTLELSDGFHAFAQKMRPLYKMAILADDNSRWSRHLRQKFDIDRYFDAVCISAETGITKPDERAFLNALEQLGCRADECVFIDDRPRNLAAAQAVGMRAVLMGSGGIWQGERASCFDELAGILAE